MANSISRPLQRIKDDLEPHLPAHTILAACQNLGHHWRNRQFDPVSTVHLFILQILHCNTSMFGLRRVAKVAMTAAAYCKARMRLPLNVVLQLVRQSADAMRQTSTLNRGKWCGLRTWLIDGSSTITPDTESLGRRFGYPPNQKKGCGFPVPKILGVFDAFTGLILDALCMPMLSHELSQVWKIHGLFGQGDLLVGDRGLCSYVHLALLNTRNVHGLFRLHQAKTVDFRLNRKRRRKNQKGRPNSDYIRRLGKYDQLVRWHRPTNKPKWMKPRQWKTIPETLILREIRYRLPYRRGMRTRLVTLVTTLVDPIQYPMEKIIQLYGVRWQVETHLGELKTTLKMRKLKSKTVAGIQKEIAIYCLVYNLVRLIMLKAALRQRTKPERISFIDTLRWLIHADPGEPIPALVVNPYRPHRYQPRVIKDRNDSYPRMTKPRSFLQKHPLFYGK